jgi:hypothetical protein
MLILAILFYTINTQLYTQHNDTFTFSNGFWVNCIDGRANLNPTTDYQTIYNYGNNSILFSFVQTFNSGNLLVNNYFISRVIHITFKINIFH